MMNKQIASMQANPNMLSTKHRLDPLAAVASPIGNKNNLNRQTLR